MGREARCRAEFNGAVAEGKALLETDELVFRSPDFKLRIPFAAMTSVEAVDGRLHVSFPDGRTSFELGAEAPRWAERILHPPTLMDKLDVKPGARVAVLGVDDERFWSALSARTGEIAQGGPGPADVVVWGVDEVGDLAAIAGMEDWIQPDGAIWAVWRKARKELTENHVREAALAAGLVDVKVARFSDTHSALKLVVPKARRRQ